MRVAVVTDSTACLSAEARQQWGVRVVDVQLCVGERDDDERRFGRDAVFAALRDGTDVSTSPPDPGAFFWTYQDAVSAGAEAIVSLHISGKLSATAEAARQGAQQIRVPVYVMDTGTIGMSLGFAVLTAARAAGAGGDAHRVMESAYRRYSRSTELIYVDTLEYLRRGGRIGGAAHLLGTALAVKPLLTISDGEVTPLTRLPGRKRALNRMTELALERAGTGQVDAAVSIASGDGGEQTLKRELEQRLTTPRQIQLSPASMVICAHLGPDALGITIAP